MECKRCATCCRKGGPALHDVDRYLFETGVLGPSDLVTLRVGELARDVTGLGENALVPLAAELLKIKGRDNAWSCSLLDEAANLCSIYDNRPSECRALFCEDATALLEAAGAPRLTRFDLLPEPLAELAREHEEQTSLATLAPLAKAAREGREAPGLVEALRYDLAMRESLVENDPDFESMLDFLLGRPLPRILRQWGLGLEEGPEGLRLVPIPLPTMQPL